MGLLGDLASFFFGNRDDSQDQPTEEDRETAKAFEQLMSSRYEDDWHAGIDMGTVPNTPRTYEGEDTDPHQPAISLSRLFPWNW